MYSELTEPDWCKGVKDGDCNTISNRGHTFASTPHDLFHNTLIPPNKGIYYKQAKNSCVPLIIHKITIDHSPSVSEHSRDGEVNIIYGLAGADPEGVV